ncbi:MAG: hypothetical protein CME38_14960 [Haliea sp.]|nr:hypothetical protein [Haliea sp.]|tara:strand:+ start:447 stop:1160 length:714 start_codon:yes stop_codon:yes gene_type:complete
MANQRKAPEKPVTLNPRLFRERNERYMRDVEFISAAKALETLSSAWESLGALYENPDPTLGRAGNALKFQKAYTKAAERAKRDAQSAMERLTEAHAARVRRAEEAAGLHTMLPDHVAAEIRQVLRGMPEKERSAAIRSAALGGDASVLLAVRNSPSPMLTGAHNVPVDSLARQMALQVDPELDQYETSVSMAMDTVGNLYKKFTTTVDQKMRDAMGEDLAASQSAAVAEAEGKLSAL